MRGIYIVRGSDGVLVGDGRTAEENVDAFIAHHESMSCLDDINEGVDDWHLEALFSIH